MACQSRRSRELGSWRERRRGAQATSRLAVRARPSSPAQPSRSAVHLLYEALAQAERGHITAGLANKLTWPDWQADVAAAEAFAMEAGYKVLTLSEDEVAAVRHMLAAERTGARMVGVEEVAAAVYARALSGKLANETQRRGDYWGGKSAVPSARCRWARASHFIAQSAVDALGPQMSGLVVLDHVLSEDEVASARSELLSLRESGELSDVRHQRAQGVRNDLIGWITPAHAEARGLRALSLVVRLLRALPAELERAGGWSLSVPEPVQAAVYEGSFRTPAFYKPHFDCKDPCTNPRRLTLIIYLNPEDWDVERDGGSLRARLRDGRWDHIPPLGGRLVCFRSTDIEHEVLPSHATRCALTLWALEASTSSTRSR